jgi:hypothetical protein
MKTGMGEKKTPPPFSSSLPSSCSSLFTSSASSSASASCSSSLSLQPLPPPPPATFQILFLLRCILGLGGQAEEEEEEEEEEQNSEAEEGLDKKTRTTGGRREKGGFLPVPEEGEGEDILKGEWRHQGDRDVDFDKKKRGDRGGRAVEAEERRAEKRVHQGSTVEGAWGLDININSNNQNKTE